MNDFPNRKKRRELAKDLGFLKRRKNMKLEEYGEELRRSIDAGKEIHRTNTEEVLRQQQEDKDNRITREIDWLKSRGMSTDEALEAAQEKYSRW